MGVRITGTPGDIDPLNTVPCPLNPEPETLNRKPLNPKPFKGVSLITTQDTNLRPRSL